MTIRFDGRVAIVTGAGGGLGRAHALALAARGARVVVNDVGNADGVVEEIHASGGEAMASAASVTDAGAVAEMVRSTMERWGRVDILVNNAGILRDRSFLKMTLEDFRAVIDVHLMGAVHCLHAVWPIMREQGYGRIVNTTSSVGLYGNFGQANYGAAKMALVGLMNVLHLEGAKYDIRINCLAPCARTKMTEGLVPDEILSLWDPEAVSPGVLFLVSEDAPSRVILDAGCGGFARTYIYETEGMAFAPENNTPESIAQRWAEISHPATPLEQPHSGTQGVKFALQAAEARGLGELPVAAG
jgi:NAD(P)-dependent dehydrogenase (short-subunit alcohol dehydrogenase family)